jgi:DhnA family fructose-bisphosphate aldolase class Ia
MPTGKQLRMRRLMGRGRSVVVALDNGNAAGVVKGLENPLEVVKMVAQAGADGILVTPGMLEQVVESIDKLAVILRIDGAVSIQGSGPMRLFCSVEQAATLGVDAVVVNATVGAIYESDELEKVGKVSTEGRRCGVPVVAEMLSERMLSDHMDFSGNGETSLPADIGDDVAMACRIGVELGADAIKTRYCGDIERFREIVHSTGSPVLVAGGPFRNKELRDTLRLVDEVLEAGAAGVIFGRSVWQQPDPAEALRAICAMVHEDATVDEALEMARL